MTAPTCPQCGKPLSGDAPQGLCPECLLKVALAAPSVLDPAATATFGVSSADAISPEAGLRLRYFGDYELLEEIARGGMGVVWKARQSSLKRVVALKMIRAGTLASPAEVERFLREAEAAANLQHPNIVAIHEVGEHGGQHYFSMDFVAGSDLGALVKNGPLAARQAARYVKIVADAIHFAHQRGTLHRDLKPQNVLIDADDQPRITDFGLAKIAGDDSRLTQSGVVMGSPSYMPPEQANGRHDEIGPASDVYSLGAMLYELLTGHAPFRGATALATLREVMETEPVPPRRLRADIPPDLETICLKCLEKTPSARYPTARALAEELDRHLAGEPIRARPASTIRKTVSWARHHPGWLAGVAAIVMVALLFGVYTLFEENAFLRAKQENPELTRAPGSRREILEIWSGINTFAMVAGIWLFIALAARARGLSIKEWRDPTKHTRPIQPLGDRVRTAAVCGGLFLVGSGIGHLAIAIQAHVWEGVSVWSELLRLYPITYFGLAVLGFAIRDFQLVHYGSTGRPAIADRPLIEEQIAPMRLALEDCDLLAAIDLYRQAVPDAGAAEASAYALRLADSLRAENPGKFVPPALSLATLNWRALAICAAIEAIILGVLWLLNPISHPSSVAVRLASAALIGVGIVAGLRVKGFLRRMLLIVPGLAALILSDEIVPRPTGESWPPSIGVYAVGFLCGMFLMISGFTRRRVVKSPNK